MSKAVAAEENLIYFEMEWNQVTGAGLYDDIVGGWEIPGTKQTSPENHVAEKSEQISTEPANSKSPSEAVMLKPLLCIIVAVVAVCLLISAVTLILVLTMMISARSTPMTSTDCSGDAVQNPWQKLNKDPICFGAQNDSYGSFIIPRTGRVKAMKLVHKSGSIYCNRGGRDSYWGCVNNQYYTINDLMTIITNTNRDALLPPAEDLQSFPRHICGKKHYYTLEGAERNSSELVFHNAVNLSQCQELQIWYGQDFADCGERDNSGTTC